MRLLSLFRRAPSWDALKDRALHEAAAAHYAQVIGRWEDASQRWNSAGRAWASAARVAPTQHRADSHQQAQACFRAESAAAETAANQHMWAEDLALEDA